MNQISMYTLKITNGAENRSLKVRNAVTEVLCKFHYGNDHLQMGQSPITVAKYSGLCFIRNAIMTSFSFNGSLSDFLLDIK